MNSVKTGTLLDATNSKNVQLSRRKSSVQYSTKESFIRDGVGKETFPCEMKTLKLKFINRSKPLRHNTPHSLSKRSYPSLGGILLSDRLLGRTQWMSLLRKKLSSERARLSDAAQLLQIDPPFSLIPTEHLVELLRLLSAIMSFQSCSLVMLLLCLPLLPLSLSPNVPLQAHVTCLPTVRFSLISKISSRIANIDFPLRYV